MSAPIGVGNFKFLAQICHCFYLTFTILSVANIQNVQLMIFNGADTLHALHNSCLVAGIHPVETEASHLFRQLADVFKTDQAVSVGEVDLDTFRWPSGRKLKWQQPDLISQTENFYSTLKKDADFTWKNRAFTKLVFIPKLQNDRSCIVKQPYYELFDPRAQYHSLPLSLEILVDFVNSKCGTYRTPTGNLSQLGQRRQEILKTLFYVQDIGEVTMGEIYKSPNNPLNQSFTWTGKSLKTENSTCNRERCQMQINGEHCYFKTDKTKSDDYKNTRKTLAKCEVRHNLPSKNEFFSTYLQHSRPVIIKNATKHWAAFHKWTEEFLRNKFGNNKVHIKLSPSSDFEGVEKADVWEDYGTFTIPDFVHKKLQFPDLVTVRPAGINMNFSEFLDLIKSTARQKKRNLSAYLEYSSIAQYMPELSKDIEELPFASGLLKQRHLNVWLSDGRTLGKLHFDPFDNLLCQVSGRKQVLMFEPHDNTKLYEAHIPQAILSYNATTKSFRRKTLEETTSMVMSPVDILKPDFERFPKFADAHPLNCTIDEGDVLYMPAFWWHEVQSFPNETLSRNMAVNYWYEPFLTKEFPCAECKLAVNPFYNHLLV